MTTDLEVVKLRTEHMHNPLGLDSAMPRLGWQLKTSACNVMQRAYRIQTASEPDFQHILWDTGKVEDDRSQGIPYEGPNPKSMERIYWRVKVWTHQGESAFSEAAFFEMGLLELEDWRAKWIEPESSVDRNQYQRPPYIRKEFTVKSGLVSARAYMTARGLYRFYINGVEGTDQLFAPGFTSYHSRLQVQTYDITPLLREGTNALGVILGDGWWRGTTGLADLRYNFGYKIAFLGQIVLVYADGTREIIGSDHTFRTSVGPLLMSDMKVGERYDARIHIEGWCLPGYDDAAWTPVHEAGEPQSNLIGTRSVPVRRKERFKPRVLHTPNGETVLDFGQNIAGWMEMTVQGEAGTEVVMVHGETLDKDGNFTLDNLALPFKPLEHFQEIRYVMRGNGPESYSPFFAVFGFRYVLLKDYPGTVEPENFTAVAIYSDLEETGDFQCSNPLLNQLVSNARWSQKGNFLDVPTDCPTRERAGWTGDAQIYCKTASWFMNVLPFFEKWLEDLAAEQYASGAVGSTIPNVLGYHNTEEWERVRSDTTDPKRASLIGNRPGEPSILDGSAGWGDAAVIIPWTMYLCYGDRRILERQYASAKAWVEYMRMNAKHANDRYMDTPAYATYTEGELDAEYIWDTKYHWGEWLEADIDIKELKLDYEERASEGDPIVATAYYAWSAKLLSEMAGILGKREDEARYSNLYRRIRKIYNRYFIRQDGSVIEGRQAPNVRVLAFDLADEDLKPQVAAKLAQMVIEEDYHLNTGFLSTPYILHVLADHGYVDLAYRLLEQETFPSWLYAVTKGATTIWESWRGITPEGKVSGSFNHYSYGAVCDFLFSYIAGIRPVMEKPGYKHFRLHPVIGGTLQYAGARYESLYGTIESEWRITGDGIRYRFAIPPNTTAEIMLPGKEKDLYKLDSKYQAQYRNGRIVFTVGSGRYEMTI